MKTPSGAVPQNLSRRGDPIPGIQPGSECWRSVGKTIARAAPNTTRVRSGWEIKR